MKKKTLRIAFLLTLCLMLAACGTASGDGGGSALDNLFGSRRETVTISKEEYEKLSRFAMLSDILDTIMANYYVEPDEQALLEGAIQGAMSGLGDTYSFYYPADSWQKMWEDDEGNYNGIGIQMLTNYNNGTVTITRVFKDTPSEQAGLRKGDLLMKVDDIDIDATTVQDAVSHMRSDKTEQIHIVVYRNSEYVDFYLYRAPIHVNRVEYGMLQDNVGYIFLYEFEGDCKAAVQTALDDLTAKGAQSIILDLRDNPGGWVDGGCYIADLFLSDGTIFYSSNRKGVYQVETADASACTLPMVLLVNENSASASEIVAAAMHDHKRATIVGTNTFGKGIMQGLAQLVSEDGTKAGFQMTIAEFVTPINRETIHKVGIAPDVLVELTDEQKSLYYEFGDMTDPQLAKAHDIAVQLQSEASPEQPAQDDLPLAAAM